MDVIAKMENKTKQRDNKNARPKVAMHNKNFATLVSNSINNSLKKNKKEKVTQPKYRDPFRFLTTAA